MKKIIMLAMLAMLALTFCFAEKYNGFEVRKGYGDVEVIVLNIDGEYYNENGDIEFEEPLFYYKAKEYQLKIIDKYVSLPDYELRNSDLTNLDKALKKLGTILDWEVDYLSEKQVDSLSLWENKFYDEFDDPDRFYEYDEAFSKSISTLSDYVRMVYTGYSSENIKAMLSKKQTVILKMLLAAFPSIKLSSLGL